MTPKGKFFFLVDVKTVGRYPVRIFRNTVLNLTPHSSTLSFTVIMACQCRLKIALCHRFDALLDSQVDRLPRPAGFHAALQTKQSMWEKVLSVL